MRIAVGNGHTAIGLKNTTKEFMEGKGYEVINLGTSPTENCDYLIYGEKVGWAVADGQADLGIAICGIGVGVSLTANKVKGVRTYVYNEPYTIKLSRVHNDSSVLAFGARAVDSELTKMVTEAWLDTGFEDGKHERRINMIIEIENR